MRQILILAAVAAISTGAVLAATADPNRTKILDGYAAQTKAQSPDFSGFSADRGRALYLGPHSGGKVAKTPACATCHTQNPAGPGRHYRTGRAIEPMAVSANPKRFTDPAEVEKRFERDCVNVLGRACTAREKCDFITFLASQ
jgi:mono/diheme cytochrome c family protein